MLFRGTRAREIPPKADSIVDPLPRDLYLKRKQTLSKQREISCKKTLILISDNQNLINVRKKDTIVKYLNLKMLMLISIITF